MRLLFVGIFVAFSVCQMFCMNVPDQSGVDRNSRELISRVPRDHFYRYCPGRMIVLLGTSSAGKSSIVNSLHQCVQKRDVIISGTDLINDRFWLSQFRKRVPSGFFCDLLRLVGQESLIDYICYGVYKSASKECKFKESIPASHKKILSSDLWTSAIDNLSMLRAHKSEYASKKIELLEDEICKPLIRGKTVLLDVVSLEEVVNCLEKSFLKSEFIVTLVYCSPKELFKHVVSRNQNSIFSRVDDFRLFFPFHQYLHLYTVSSLAVDSIDFICKQDFLFKFSDILPESSQLDSQKRKELGNLLKDNESFMLPYKEQVLDLWFSTSDYVFIKPKFRYDLLFNTGVLLSDEVASVVAKIIKP